MNSIRSYFSVISPEEAAELKRDTRWSKAQKAVADQARSERQRQGAAERQRKRRARIKQDEVLLGERDPETLRKIRPMKLQAPSPDRPADPSTGSATHPSNPTKPRAPRTNYYEPTHWKLIDRAARLHNFSPQAIVRELKLSSNSGLFTSIDRGTVGAWINKDHTAWKPVVLERVARAAEGNTPRVPIKPLGRPQLLSQILVTSIITLLTTMRAAGTLITRAVARSVVMAFVKTDAPDLYENPKFKCSDAFVRNVLRDKLEWSWRATTQAAQKLPDNWLQQCTDFACRLTWNIALNKVPPELVINADQTGVSFLGTGDRTWDVRGASQVAAVGKGEKRQFTLMVAVASSGDMLPFQAIFKGKTKNSLPSEKARADGERIGFQFTPGGEKHWSTLAAMKEWVENVIVPYAKRKRDELKLSLLQKMILILDCWSVHKGEEFLKWMKANHPLIILLFVPAGCTSIAQPCDTRINRIMKHLIKSACVEYLSQQTQRQLQAGISASQVELDTTLCTLRDASAAWLMEAWTWFQEHPQTVRDAWRDTTFGEWDLSYETLASARCRAIVYERFNEETAFSLAISSQIPTDPDFVEADSPEFDDDSALDPDLLVDIRGRLPMDVELEREGSYVYTGDAL